MKTKLILIAFISFMQLNAQCWKEISCNYSHNLAIKTDGTLWAWGYNNFGQIGQGPTGVLIATQTQIGTNSNWLSVSAGADFSIALKTDGTLWAWGANSSGQLGDGTTSNKTIPTQIGTATNWTSIATGDAFVIAKKSNGTLWAWGNNASGQLGDGTTINKNVPTQIGTNTTWNTFACGGSHVLVLRSNGTLWAWGKNDYGQLGDGTSINKTSPLQIGTATDWFTLAAGSSYSLAIKNTLTLWGWGSNIAGQLGDGTLVSKSTPTQVGTSTDWFIIGAGVGSSFGLKANGTLWSWGNNAYGQLGIGSTTNVATPTQVGTDTHWYLKFDSAQKQTIALKDDGSRWVWGSNDGIGLLGNSSNNQTSVPVMVNCPTSLTTDQFITNSIAIAPNPVNDNLTISLNNSETIEQISIYDLFGKEVIKNTEHQSIINTEKLSSGFYILKVVSNGKEFQSKFIKN